MRRGATREEIIRTTEDLIARNGIRAVRVDEIAQTLSISKRTLYEMFADKTDLVLVCLDQMSRRRHERIATYLETRCGTPLEQATEFTRKYIDDLYAVGSRFLSEVQHTLDFSEYFDKHEQFSHNELARILTECRQAGVLLPEINTKRLSDWILNTLLELRLNNASREELALFCRTMLRGTSTQAGINQLDRYA